ncbi:STAS-like domain-containing protein [Marinobacter sp. MA]|uniref:STAS-like domain-containing protein n=1 Tax=Marinobacter sp. MA TaxID=2971606 RepID=UPI003AB0C431
MTASKQATVVINIGRDYSPIPFGRYRSDGKYSAEKFRDDILIPAMRNNKLVIIELDDVRMSYGSSFLEETFGGLIRRGFSSREILEKIEIRTELSDYRTEIQNYISRAEQAVAH